MAKKTYTYKGFIREADYRENMDAIFIGNAAQPITEIFADDFQGKIVTVRYWISGKEKTKEELMVGVLKKFYGAVEAEYEDRYSEITGYLWTDEDLNIGGHNIILEIMDKIGKYIHLEVDVHEE